MRADDEPTQSLLDGRYRLEVCVGRGATSMVYRAEDLMLGRPVAIKVLRQPDEMPVSMERVRTETAILANLKHPSLVTLYDARLEQGGPQYLAMEYVSGPTLASLLRGGALPVEHVAAIARDLAEGLQAVHEIGVVHRDVKPSNVLTAERPEPGQPPLAKLTDFGIASELDDARRTSPGIAIGTAAYMAPEQVRSAELTTAMDIYSLGLVLIEALTGEAAFPATGGVQTALARLTEHPHIPDSVDANWRDLLERMTRIEPTERPTAREVADAATALLARATQETAPTVGPFSSTSVAVAETAEVQHPDASDASDASDAPDDPTREYPPMTAAVASISSRLRSPRAGAVAVGIAAASLAMVAGVWNIAPAAEAPPVVSPTSTSVPAAPTEPIAESDGDVVTAVSDASSSGTAKSDADRSTTAGNSKKPADTASKSSGNGPDKTSGNGPDRNSGSGPEENSGNGSDGSSGKRGNGQDR